jgi:Flp pilus assembly protein TadG
VKLTTLREAKHKLIETLSREDGSSMIELAIMLPILVIMFVGTVELGRLFYTYTTLAKATKVGARYLSTSRDATSGDAATANAAILNGKSLVVCGAIDCTGQTPVVAGLTPATNVAVTFPVVNGVKYVQVQIQSYTFAAGVFNLASKTGNAYSAFYFALTPSTRMRYVQ